MKLSNFIALCALSFSAVSGVAEAKFAPTSFVGKKQKTPSNDVSQLNEALLSSRGGSASSHSNVSVTKRSGEAWKLSSLVSRVRGGIAESVTPEFTFYMDIFWTVLVTAFMYLWLNSRSIFESSTEYPDTFPNFNKQVLVDGFCIEQNKEDTLLGLGTLKWCGIVDAFLIISSYFKYKDTFSVGNNKLVYYGSAAYTLIHGLIHGLEVDQTGLIWSENNSLFENISGVALLALITGFTPIGIKSNFDAAGKENGLLVGVAAWIGFVLYYMFGIKEKVYALTYINATIFLSIFASRALVFKKDDPNRTQFYFGKSIMATIIALTVNMIVMAFEPLVCKDWFAGVGGHVWFDVTLWLMMMSMMQ